MLKILLQFETKFLFSQNCVLNVPAHPPDEKVECISALRELFIFNILHSHINSCTLQTFPSTGIQYLHTVDVCPGVNLSSSSPCSSWAIPRQSLEVGVGSCQTACRQVSAFLEVKYLGASLQFVDVDIAFMCTQIRACTMLFICTNVPTTGFF